MITLFTKLGGAYSIGYSKQCRTDSKIVLFIACFCRLKHRRYSKDIKDV